MSSIRYIKFLLLGLLFLQFPLQSHAQKKGDDEKAMYAISFSRDSVAPQIYDLKQGFQNLFVTTTLANGINTDQLNPLAISFVQDYMDRFGKTMTNMKSWGKPYFDMMDGILTKHGLPKELKYLAVIESHLKSTAKSWAGAVGPWQFMPETARNFGLKVSNRFDERTDYFKSTHAACRYLTNLFSLYGDWLLVIAAYNGGPGNVNSAIRKSGSKDFWSLQNYLPAESKNHVKKFIATHYMMEGQGGVTTSTKEEALNQLTKNNNPTTIKEDTVELRSKQVNGRFISNVIVKYVDMDLGAFNRLNPDFDQQIADFGTYVMRLPADKMELFIPKRYDILYESIQLLLKTPDSARP